MGPAPTAVTTSHRHRELNRNVRFGFADGIAFSVMVGLGETYLAAFALALGFGVVFVGLLTTVPLLAGAILQLVSPRGVRWMGSLRRWVVLSTAVQAATFLPLIGAAVLDRASPWLLILAASLYWGSGMASGPAWTSWMEYVIPSRIRARYFASRSSATHLSVFLGILAGGLLLQLGKETDRLLGGFAAVFSLAGLFRAVSSVALSRQSGVPPGSRRHESLHLRGALDGLRESSEGRFLLYLLSMQAAVAIAMPYFTPYMLRGLEMSYAQYMGLLAASFAAKTAFLLLAGRHATRLGILGLLQVGSIGVTPLAALWLVSPSFSYLIGLQIVSGCVWACYELAVLLLILEKIPVHKRTAVLTAFNLAHAFVTVAGSLAGALLLRIAGPHGYSVVFAASSCARLLTLPLLRGLGPFPRITKPIYVRTIGVRPSGGSVWRPLLSAWVARARRAGRGRRDGPETDHSPGPPPEPAS